MQEKTTKNGNLEKTKFNLDGDLLSGHQAFGGHAELQADRKWDNLV